jgi:hypothetical protein
VGDLVEVSRVEILEVRARPPIHRRGVELLGEEQDARRRLAEAPRVDLDDGEVAEGVRLGKEVLEEAAAEEEPLDRVARGVLLEKGVLILHPPHQARGTSRSRPHPRAVVA